MKPTVIVNLKNLGSSVVIVCNITLNTAIGPDLSVLNYTWYQNKKLMNQGILFYRIDEMAFTTELEITVKASNAGVYRCNAGIVGGNTITSNTTSLCAQGIIIIYKLFTFNYLYN